MNSIQPQANYFVTDCHEPVGDVLLDFAIAYSMERPMHDDGLLPVKGMRELSAYEIRDVAGGLQVGIDPGIGALLSAYLCDIWWNAGGIEQATCVPR